MKENYAFIDFQNMRLAIKALGWMIDLKRLRVYLKDKYHIKKAFIFIGFIDENKEFYKMLEDFGYKLIFKPTLTQKGVIKGNVDAELVLHSMIEYPKFDKGVIITGDGDFYCLVDYFIKKRKLLKLLIPNSKTYSSLLKRFGKDHIDFMDVLKKKVEYKKSERQLHKD